jgi:hypothetical protein
MLVTESVVKWADNKVKLSIIVEWAAVNCFDGRPTLFVP